MIYLRNQLISNLNEASKSQDKRALEDLFIDALSDILSYKKDDVIEVLNTEKIPVEQPVNDRNIVNAILTYLPSNKRLAVGVSYMIVENNDLLNELEKKHIRGDKTPVKKQKPNSDTVTKINNMLLPVYSSLQNKDVYDKMMNGVMKHLIVKSEVESSADGMSTEESTSDSKQQPAGTGKSNTNRNLIIGVSVVAILCVAGYFYYKYTKGKAAALKPPVIPVT